MKPPKYEVGDTISFLGYESSTRSTGTKTKAVKEFKGEVIGIIVYINKLFQEIFYNTMDPKNPGHTRKIVKEEHILEESLSLVEE